jgi:nicotinamide mononucleotide transporter PnuC
MKQNKYIHHKAWWQYIIFFYNWTVFEQILLITNFLVVFLLFGFSYQANLNALDLSALWVSLIGNCLNTISVLLVIRKKICSLFYGIAKVVCLGYVSWCNQLLGSTILYVCYLFAQCLAFYLWYKSSDNKIDIKIRKLPLKMMIILVVVVLILSVSFYFANRQESFHNLFFIHDNNHSQIVYVFDALGLVINLSVLFLSLLRYRERWISSLVGDLILLTMWALNSTNNVENYIMVIVYATMFISSAYGLYCWYKKGN